MDRKDFSYYARLPYRMDLRFDRDDHVWLISYPELPGCDAHGATAEEALAAGEEVKKLWLATALDHGDAIREPEPEPEYSGRLVLRLPRTLHRQATLLAERDGTSLNQFLVVAIAATVGVREAHRQFAQTIESFWLPAFNVVTHASLPIANEGLNEPWSRLLAPRSAATTFHVGSYRIESKIGGGQPWLK